MITVEKDHKCTDAVVSVTRPGLGDFFAAVAASSDDIGMVGRLLGQRAVNTMCFKEKELPDSRIRHPSKSKTSLLDVAVGSGSIEMTKYLLEFHGAEADGRR
jgi:hypothetical protein